MSARSARSSCRRGAAAALATACGTPTTAFAAGAGYRKLVIQVRGSNAAAQAFYRGLGFQACGRLSRQVIIDGVEDDEVLMERFIEGAPTSDPAARAPAS